jgi:hypothetical protein
METKVCLLYNCLHFYQHVQGTKSGAGLDCDQYANDLAVLTSFPFKMNLQKQGPNISTAILDPSGTTVAMIQLRQAGATVPESVFCLKHCWSLEVMNMVLMNGKKNCSRIINYIFS